MIKTASFADLPRIAECHCAAFPDALSSAMGKRYVARMLSWYLSGDKTFLFFFEKNGICAGYCGGMIADGVLPTGSASGMLRHSMGAALRSFALRPWLVFHPELRAKYPLIWRNMAYVLGFRSRKQAVPAKTREWAPGAGLVVIGTHPGYRGQGIGSALLDEFERRAVEVYGMRRMYLSVRPDNQTAIWAYERKGWVCVGVGQYEKVK